MDLNERLRLAIKYYQEGNVLLAESMFNEILKAQPYRAEAYFYLGNILQDKRQPDDAITQYQKAIELNPHFVGSHYNLGSIFYEKGQIDEAIEHFQKALKIDPNFADIYNTLGVIFLKIYQIDKAMEHFQKALKIDPNFAIAYNNLGSIFQGKENLDEAIIYYQRALELDPNYARAYFNLGNVHHAKGHIDEAINCYKKSIELNPYFFDSYFKLGVILQANEQFLEAANYYQKAIELNPNADNVYFNLGNIFFLHIGEHERGVTCYEKALQLNPHLAEECNRRGLVIPDKQKVDETKKYYSTLSRHYPHSIQYILASYPRSGNHWIRYIIEWFSKKPTLGSGDAIIREFWDTPIHKGIAMTNLGSMTITNSEPIAIKRHQIEDTDDRNLGLILIVRDFNECIIKHIRAHKTKTILLDRLMTEIDMYMKLLYDYDGWNNNKLLVYYEDLIDNYQDEIRRLLHFCNLYDKTEFHQFIIDYENHKIKSISYYDRKAQSETKGREIRYYLNLVPDDKKLLIQNTILDKNSEIFHKYLDRYRQ